MRHAGSLLVDQDDLHPVGFIAVAVFHGCTEGNPQYQDRVQHGRQEKRGHQAIRGRRQPAPQHGTAHVAPGILAIASSNMPPMSSSWRLSSSRMPVGLVTL